MKTKLLNLYLFLDAKCKLSAWPKCKKEKKTIEKKTRCYKQKHVVSSVFIRLQRKRERERKRERQRERERERERERLII